MIFSGADLQICRAYGAGWAGAESVQIERIGRIGRIGLCRGLGIANCR